MGTIFDKIVSGEMKSWIIWEDDDYMAFLTPFANTPGHTVVIKKVNPGDYIFTVDDETYTGMLSAVRKVAKLLEKAFSTSRVGVLFDGTGVPHLHAQLIPFHANLSLDENEAQLYRVAHPELAHHLTASDGPKMSDEQLDQIRTQIVEANV